MRRGLSGDIAKGGKGMTTDEHRARHLVLHQSMDELLADYIGHHPEQVHFFSLPVEHLLQRSYTQTTTPTETEDKVSPDGHNR